MNTLLTTLGAAVLGLALTLSPVRADEAPPPSNPAEQAEKAIREGAQKMIEALELLIRSIPQYETPKMLDNGDIIIRRKPPDPAPEPDQPKRTPPADDHTQT